MNTATISSEDLFLYSIILVVMLAAAVAFALKLLCNYVHRYGLCHSRNAENEVYRTCYERTLQYYRRLSSYMRRNQG